MPAENRELHVSDRPGNPADLAIRQPGDIGCGAAFRDVTDTEPVPGSVAPTLFPVLVNYTFYSYSVIIFAKILKSMLCRDFILPFVD